MKKSSSSYLFISKLIYTMMIIAIYEVMRMINLFGVDVSKMINSDVNADMLIGQIVGGDLYRCSITAVGFAPYMIAGIIVMVLQTMQSSDSKSQISSKKINRYTLLLTVIIALIQSILRSNELEYIYTGVWRNVARFISIYEMVLGTLLVLWLSMRNKRYGIGGQMSLILVNVYGGIVKTIQGIEVEKIVRPVLFGFAMMLIMIFMENAEKRIPLQRISIHNIYADKNYQAIKFNPIGVMPVLFASAVFMLPQFIVKTILLNSPNNKTVTWLVDNMVLGKPLGIFVYICIIYILNLLLAWAMINPKDLADAFLKSGDGIENIRPGKATRRYLRRNLLFRTFISSTVLSICLGGSMLLQMSNGVDSKIAMLPTSIMMFSGLGCTIYRESEAIISMDSYSAII